MASSTSARF
ncbi:hypothetical protein EC34870_1590A, partial [Escherichia coli 3.4870]